MEGLPVLAEGWASQGLPLLATDQRVVLSGSLLATDQKVARSGRLLKWGMVRHLQRADGAPELLASAQGPSCACQVRGIHMGSMTLQPPFEDPTPKVPRRGKPKNVLVWKSFVTLPPGQMCLKTWGREPWNSLCLMPCALKLLSLVKAGHLFVDRCSKASVSICRSVREGPRSSTFSTADAIASVARQLCELFSVDLFGSPIALQIHHGGQVDHLLAGFGCVTRPLRCLFKCPEPRQVHSWGVVHSPIARLHHG